MLFPLPFRSQFIQVDGTAQKNRSLIYHIHWKTNKFINAKHDERRRNEKRKEEPHNIASRTELDILPWFLMSVDQFTSHKLKIDLSVEKRKFVWIRLHGSIMITVLCCNMTMKKKYTYSRIECNDHNIVYRTTYYALIFEWLVGEKGKS